MYEVELIKKTGAEALREKQGHLPGIQPGMQIVNTETVAKRLYMYNNGTRLPEGIQMSPPGELIENQGVSAENSAYDNMQPCGAQPIYQTHYEWPYTQPQRPKLTSKTMVPLNNADRFHDPDAACGQGPIMTNFVLGIVNPSDIKKNASNSISTNSTTPSSSSPVKSRSKSQPRSRNAEEQCRGSSLCTCGHDSRTCPVCSERRHMH
ncbi:hypothetical protein MRX96_015612 [Rhipicephalus microplus]